MRVGIVHDYLVQAGGAERVVEAMHPVFPDAPIYTSVFDPKTTFDCFARMDVRTSFLQQFGWARSVKWHKFALPLFPVAFESFDFSGYDCLLSSSSAFAKGVITGPETCHICYCHTPARFAWRFHEYLSQNGYNTGTRHLLKVVLHFLRNWDYATAQTRVDYFLTNSYNVSRRVRKFYGRQSRVLYPPVDTSRFSILEENKSEFFLVVSRLVPYKRVDLAVEACTRLGLPLKVVGGGPDLDRLKAMAGPTVEILGQQSDQEVVRLMRECKAFIFPGEEDFGIAPVEAMASGRPVIALRAGGALETVVENETGIFFDESNTESLIDALQNIGNMNVDSERIRRHATRFDTRHFQHRLRRLVDECVTEHRFRYNAIAPQFGKDDPPLPPRHPEDIVGFGVEEESPTHREGNILVSVRGR